MCGFQRHSSSPQAFRNYNRRHLGLATKLCDAKLVKPCSAPAPLSENRGKVVSMFDGLRLDIFQIGVESPSCGLGWTGGGRRGQEKFLCRVGRAARSSTYGVRSNRLEGKRG